MAFTVEDGTGLADANSYGAVADYRSYHNDRANEDAVSYSDEEIQAALIRATDYIEWRFSTRFMGSALVPETQALSFPREDLYDRNGQLVEGVPERLKRAVFEYAARALEASLAPDPVVDETGKAVVAKRTKVGPIETELQYEGGGAASNVLRSYPAADALVREYLRAGGGVMR